MSWRENKEVVWGLGISAVLVGVLLWLLFGGSPFILVVLFDDVGDLKEGDPVVWKTFNIGKVDKIEPLVDNQIGVKIRLKDDYAPKITRGSEFTLKRASLLGFIGQNAIEVTTPEAAGEPFAGGDKVQGRNPRVSLLEEGRRVTLEYWEGLRTHASRLMEEFRSSPHRAEAEEALGRMKTLAEEGVKQAQGEIEEFRREHEEEIELIRKRLEALRDLMLREGDRAGAERLDGQIEQLKKK